MEEEKMPLIGDIAPSFKAKTTNGDINFPEDYKGKWVILFSHPADFTPVCTTEFMTFGKMFDEFKSLNTELVGLSVDSISSHLAWIKTIEKLTWKDMKNIKIKFPVIEDIGMKVSNKYGMIQPNVSDTKAVRAVFVIDPDSKIRTILYYPLSLGRNFQELKRIIMALQESDANKISLPADWIPSNDVIIPPPITVKQMDELAISSDKYCLDWFLCFKKNSMSKKIK